MTSITKTICPNKNGKVNPTMDNQYNIELYTSLAQIEEEWLSISEGKDIFYSPDFLFCIEERPPSDIMPYYGIVRDESQVVGILYFQSKYVRLHENLRNPGKNENNTLGQLTTKIKRAVVKTINFHTVVCGNLLLTGRYGFCFKDGMSDDIQFSIVSSAIDKLTVQLKSENIKPGLILVKDFFESNISVSDKYGSGFTKFTVQPKMILDLDPNWKSFDDYLDSMKSKYRVRARKAKQKSTGLIKKVFSVDEIAEHRETIHTLYKNVSDQADFNAFILDKRYFEDIQLRLGKNLKFTTYWLNDVMVAFFTSIKNYDVLDAHFLGYDPDVNAECQLYLNMLYDLVQEGIDKKVSKVDMSRTAVEIKSTVGAVPHSMYLYLKHTNSLLNSAVESILSFVKPEEEFIIRSPFREAGE